MTLKGGVFKHLGCIEPGTIIPYNPGDTIMATCLNCGEDFRVAPAELHACNPWKIIHELQKEYAALSKRLGALEERER